MKKVVKSRIFLVIITIIACISVSVTGAVLYNASEVGFTPANSSWKVNNIESAINDLYTAKNSVVDTTNYTLGEQVIGKWTDGRPVYRFTYVFTKTVSGDVIITFETMGLNDYTYLDKVMKSESHVISSVDNFASNEYYMTASDFYGHYIKKDKKSVVFRSGSEWPRLPSEMLFVMEYTKTSDPVPTN